MAKTAQETHPLDMKLPMVEWFETVEGEGTRAGYPTTFIRVFNCNLRCRWCDTPYSYAPHKPEFFATIREILSEVRAFGHPHICLTGGEPLMHGEKSLQLVRALAEQEIAEDIHIETNGAVDLAPFAELRRQHALSGQKVRFILDYKLPASGENESMLLSNFEHLRDDDEIKFVIADQNDFDHAVHVLKNHLLRGVPLFSPVWETMPPERLVRLMLEHRLSRVKLNLQMHKIIWHPDQRGV